MIVKNKKFGEPQKSLPQKVLAFTKVLKKVYGKEHWSCDMNE